MTIPKQLLEAKICNKNTCELQGRIDKAIEYIINYYFYNSLDFDVKELLDILKGSDSNGHNKE